MFWHISGFGISGWGNPVWILERNFHMGTIKNKFIVSLIAGVVILSACTASPTPDAEPGPTLSPSETAQLATETELAPSNTATTAPPTPTETTQPTATDDNLVSFSEDIFPIVQNRCLNCHGGDRIEEGLDMTSYAGIMAGSVNGAIVNAGDAENSLFVELVASQKMPKRGAKLTPSQVQLFRDWVNQGALDN